jgi:hypothetical protein
MPKPRYKTIYDYMDRTGTSQRRLLQQVKDVTGRTISPAMFSMILRGSRRCSRWNAFALHIVTGVPMAELTRWPRYAETEKTQSVA